MWRQREEGGADGRLTERLRAWMMPRGACKAAQGRRVAPMLRDSCVGCPSGAGLSAPPGGGYRTAWWSRSGCRRGAARGSHGQGGALTSRAQGGPRLRQGTLHGPSARRVDVRSGRLREVGGIRQLQGVGNHVGYVARWTWCLKCQGRLPPWRRSGVEWCWRFVVAGWWRGVEGPSDTRLGGPGSCCVG